MSLKSYKTRTRTFTPGFGLILELSERLPRRYDEKRFGSGDDKGLVLVGQVVAVLGGEGIAGWKQDNKEPLRITIRPEDARKTIFDDLAKTNEESRFLLEGVTGDVSAMEARWVHGAGENRFIEEVEIVGAPHVTFENPVKDGPRSGYLRLNLDGTATTYDERLEDGTWMERVIPYTAVVERLGQALDQDLRFRVSQRVLLPSKAITVDGQEAFEVALAKFRALGMTHCIVRTFATGTTDPQKVDIQLLAWPQDAAPNGTFAGATYEMPELEETKRFAALRDGGEDTVMEVIPGYMLSLVGNPNDKTKSVKHKFVENIVKGHSDKQKSMFASQSYGPGIAIRAVNEKFEMLGLVRIVVRTDGPQYRNIFSIPTINFDAAAFKWVGGDAHIPAESGAEDGGNTND